MLVLSCSTAFKTKKETKKRKEKKPKTNCFYYNFIQYPEKCQTDCPGGCPFIHLAGTAQEREVHILHVHLQTCLLLAQRNHFTDEMIVQSLPSPRLPVNTNYPGGFVTWTPGPLGIKLRPPILFKEIYKYLSYQMARSWLMMTGQIK